MLYRRKRAWKDDTTGVACASCCMVLDSSPEAKGFEWLVRLRVTECEGSLEALSTYAPPPLPVRHPTSDVLCSVAGLFGPLEHRQIGIGYWPNQWYLNYCCYIARRREECVRSSVGATNCFVRFNARTSIRETTALLIFRCLYIHRVCWGVLRACNAPCIRLSMSWSITSLIGS